MKPQCFDLFFRRRKQKLLKIFGFPLKLRTLFHKAKLQLFPQRNAVKGRKRRQKHKNAQQGMIKIERSRNRQHRNHLCDHHITADHHFPVDSVPAVPGKIKDLAHPVFHHRCL